MSISAQESREVVLYVVVLRKFRVLFSNHELWHMWSECRVRNGVYE